MRTAMSMVEACAQAPNTAAAHVKPTSEGISTISFLNSGCLSSCREESTIEFDNICLHSHNFDGVVAKRKLPAASCSLASPTNESAIGAFTVPDTKLTRNHLEVYLALVGIEDKKTDAHIPCQQNIDAMLIAHCSLRFEWNVTNMYILFKWSYRSGFIWNCVLGCEWRLHGPCVHSTYLLSKLVKLKSNACKNWGIV